ncbi:MAG: hypothetical protein Q7R68_00385 [Nitrospirales bacterium]|nr:hypothetical protein [Nitrospirales bacterium]
MTSAIRLLALLLLVLASPASAAPVPDPQGEWARLTQEAAEMGLPSRFLRLLPLEFVKLEFADLKNVAAEYHPDSHRMVFHLSLSEGNQGKRFRPIRDISSQDLATLYHELFHAYFDYVDFASGTPKMTPQGARLHEEAKRFLSCRYTVVELSPGPPRKGVLKKTRIEKRRLAEREGWDALNETWGVFVGWAIWNKLEATDRLSPAARWDWDALEDFLERLDDAYSSGDLTGYFEPVNPEERKTIPRRYLAPTHGISTPEIALLLEVILDEPPGMARLAASWIALPDGAAGRIKTC